MNLHQPTSSSGSYLPESAETYFRWGIPSLVLAFVTTALALYSFLWVQPNLRTNYRKFCDSELAALNISLDNSVSPDIVSSTSDLADPLALERRIHQLEKLQLSLKRLVFWNKEDAITRYQLALTSLSLHHSTAKLAKLMPRDDPERPRFMAESGNALAATTDAMRAVARLNSDFALNANLWLTQQKLDDGNLAHDQLRDVEAQLLAWNDAADPSTFFLSVLGSAQWKQSTHPSSQIDQDRIDAATRCANSLEQAPNPTITLRTLLAKCELILSRPDAKRTAQSILDQYGVSISDVSIGPEQVACIYEALLMTGEIVEAQSYMIAWLNNSEWTDQEELLRKLNRESLNLFVAGVFADRTDILEPILGIAFRAGTAGPILAFLQRQLLEDSGEKNNLNSVLARVLAGRDGMVRFVLLLQQSIGAGQWDAFDAAIASIKGQADGRNILAVQAVLIASELGVLEASQIYRCIETIRDRVPLPFEVDLQLLEVLLAKEQTADAQRLYEQLKTIQPDHPKLQNPP